MDPLEIAAQAASEPTEQEASLERGESAPPPDVAARWDATLTSLWDTSLTAALAAAEALYAPDDAHEEDLPLVQEEVAANFWRLLMSRYKARPETASLRYGQVLSAVWRMLRAIRTSSTIPFMEDYLAVGLRPIRQLQAGLLTSEVCAILYAYHRGVWTPHLTKPQLFQIQEALAKTLNALPPDAMGAFWANLLSDEPLRRGAMLLGVEWLRNAHAVPHLLRGLEQCPHHDTRTVIVNALEQIADPRALQTLMRVRREMASTDWPLSRQISRAIRVIEQQNRNQHHRTLLRPSLTTSEEPASLLRPASDAARLHAEEEKLLRPTEPPDEQP
ncbi:MAG TPA: hypothetical protein VKU00_12330 [Chthonomonadaceae bacterium]|nr:hypothetical protein [Chthonomonadaceae bacterium]